MKVYEVGGAVRDRLLGRPVHDRDYVVVGATPEEMERHGFKPVGKDFPVFLHPVTRAEYALARTERKTGRGYKGFQVSAAPDVTLEEDLARRDLTVNAMALDDDGRLIDPFGGAQDLRAGVLRHVSAAFPEDPVRILRVARFAARFGFRVAPATLDLMKEMVAAGEVDALVAERVWQELARGLMEAVPSRMLHVLRECGALRAILPEVEALFGMPFEVPGVYSPPGRVDTLATGSQGGACPGAEVSVGAHSLRVLDCTADRGLDLPARFAALTQRLGDQHSGGQRSVIQHPASRGSNLQASSHQEPHCPESGPSGPGPGGSGTQEIATQVHGDDTGLLAASHERFSSKSLATPFIKQRGDPRSEASERGEDLILQLCERLRVPNDCRDLAVLTARLHTRVDAAAALDADGLLNLLTQADALRQRERFSALLQVCACDFHVRDGGRDRPYEPRRRLECALTAALAVDAGAVARRQPDKGRIRAAVYEARLAALREALAVTPGD